MSEPKTTRYREIGPERKGEFLGAGYKERHVFAHRLYYLPKCGPDGLKLARSMCGSCRLDELSEIVLYAHPSALAEFPEQLFFDNDLCWHQQQFGIPGQIATVNLLRRGSDLYTMVHQSDLVQRASRVPAHRTRLQNRFKGWNFMLFNAILNFAVEQQIRYVYTPTSELALRNTDPRRAAKPDLFERIYDRQLRQIFNVSSAGQWWKLEVDDNRHLLIKPQIQTTTSNYDKIICICHDVERGLGHTACDPEFAKRANETAPSHLRAMLDIERRLNIRATYNVVGQLLPEVRGRIEPDGHTLAFHSYDHWDFDKSAQLGRCREIDYRLKGYRPPQSRITAELSDENLCFHNFEWLASSAYSLGFSSPIMENRIVKIPIRLDDFDLYRRTMDFAEWSRRAVDIIKESEFAVFSLHDCYGSFWLSRYEDFLRQILSFGNLQTLNEVTNRIILAHSA